MNKVVYTYGVWDLFHYGHIKMLKQAKALGDKLIIGVFTDKVAQSFKRKPIMDENERQLLIRELNIGEVVMQDEFLPVSNIKKYKPDIVAKGEGAGWGKTIPQFEGVESILLPYTDGISTSKIIKRIYENNI